MEPMDENFDENYNSYVGDLNIYSEPRGGNKGAEVDPVNGRVQYHVHSVGNINSTCRPGVLRDFTFQEVPSY